MCLDMFPSEYGPMARTLHEEQHKQNAQKDGLDAMTGGIQRHQH
jgi:hypothetical protein